MSEKRRGLGRGLGALIPTSSEGRRPVDVFFPSPSTDEPKHHETSDAAESSVDQQAGEDAATTSVTTLVADADAGPADLASLTSLSDAYLAELDAVAAGDTAHSSANSAPTRDSSTTDQAKTDRATINSATTDSATTDSATTDSATTDSATTAAVSRETTSDSSPKTGTEQISATESGGPSPAESASVEEWTGGAADDLVPVPGARFAELPTSSIRPNPRQPRTVFDEGELDELIGSIREIGVLQPIVVRPVTGESAAYELIMGERRWRATQAAGLDVIPAIVRETDDADLLRDALLENLHRSALNPLEEAAAYRQLLDDFGCTHEELADRISRSRPQISNTLRLLRLPPLVQRRVAAGVLSAGHARALLGLTDGAEIERLAQRIVAEGLSVRATEEIVAMGGLDGERRAPRTPRAGQRSAAIDELAHRLSDRFETRVKVDLGKNKGRLTVEFASVEDLNRILDVMAPDDPGLLRK
ncbi:ParB/RepB/Spo0J family partition protein [Cellulosimicrobium sp. XJ-DQ-B-000]|uniref:ParB/RepB/Spo0J family partition protein n=1 Tax=Cellulosimicrobium sp. XJ-DQ-B-000 TaxID=3072182 RepID=UPI00280877FD|nr:ParB/RepB/Spo0J family partition protein [Cellulosimicrobium sp. XJ-DQ-B-000]MDQ8041977.1 ParB/RepB/Spo0J family partition protein [Cellulosimicrobium sp. XJ-DQ-B-000]